ncbi:uncharacterized protein ACMZJ9_014478 [Mantella aurantiaca]
MSRYISNTEEFSQIRDIAQSIDLWTVLVVRPNFVPQENLSVLLTGWRRQLRRTEKRMEESIVNSCCEAATPNMQTSLEIMPLAVGMAMPPGTCGFAADYKVVKKLSGDPLSPNRRLHRTSPITEPPPHCLTPEVTRAKKVLGDCVIVCVRSLQGVRIWISTRTSRWRTSHHRDEDVSNMKIEVTKEEETYVKGDQQFAEEVVVMDTIKEEKAPSDIGSDGCNFSNTSEECLVLSQDKVEDKDIVQYYPGMNPITSNIHHRPDQLERSIDPSNPKKSSIRHERDHTGESSISCLGCGKSFTMRSELYKHLRSHTRVTYTCSECEESFTEESEYLEHQKTHDPYSCSQCGKSFTLEGEFETHQKSHTGESPYLCSECSKCFIEKDPSPFLNITSCPQQMRRRYSDGHFAGNRKTFEGDFILSPDYNLEDNDITQYSPEEKPLPHNIKHEGDRTRASSFTETRDLPVHHRGPERERPYACPECGKCFTQKGDLVSHQRIHTGERPYSCSECGKCFINKSSLVAHSRSHTGERPYSCSECEKFFTDKRSFLAHRGSHTGEYPYSCSECGKGFSNRRSLITHQSSHTGVRPYSCSECGKGFVQKHHLLAHQRIHTGEYPYSCSECGKGFTYKSSFVAHSRSHTGEYLYSCSECGKGFTTKASLNVHQTSHMSERPYSCSECEKCFTQKRLLLVHQRRHTGERPYSCSECGKCFTLKDELHKHQRIHTGERPYPCSECGKCFTTKVLLLSHQRIHTGERPYSCSDCGKGFIMKAALLQHLKTHD